MFGAAAEVLGTPAMTGITSGAVPAETGVISLILATATAVFGGDGSMRWFWQTVAATCCWAASDVICDSCIKPAEVQLSDGKSADESCSQSLEASASHSQEKCIQADGLESESSMPADKKAAEPAAEGEIRKRKKPARGSTQPHPQPRSAPAKKPPRPSDIDAAKKPSEEAVAPKTAPCSSLRPEALHSVETSVGMGRPTPSSCPRSPLIGHCHVGPLLPPLEGLPSVEDDASCKRLTPEQNALVSGLVSLLTVGLTVMVVERQRSASLCPGGASGSCVAASGNMTAIEDSTSFALGSIWESFVLDRRAGLAAIGGCFHFLAYLSTLCAFSSASSTVITPLMQLSAIWMLPFSTLTAQLGHATLIRPAHLVSVLMICAGGILPAAEGSLSMLFTKKFWQQRAVRYVGLGELLICCYNLILHQATFDDGSVDDASASSSVAGTMRFFLVSRVANGLTCLGLFAFTPSLRRHIRSIKSCGTKYLVLAFLGECLSMMGVCMVTFSYSSFYEPSVVNAAEGGLQQLFNLLFALLSHSALGFGRKVDMVSVKMTSFFLVATGLVLSTT
eukprot:TRINITY_DN28980_c0_g1_i1.p1 TRINITY_DN28980_c0_g1~~TRINITY_DN28980_c0_g1_i1.p1  ORF type:complete len:563 (+),score=99.96 TRINITY_DN28980_c0_g1_i1:191-1879(+)